jgi:hypothetical protein
MRLKLVSLASFIAAVIGTGSCVGIVLTLFSPQKPAPYPGVLMASTLLLPIAAISFASIFVYRHTARRRKLQAFLTAIVATLLTLSLLLLASILSGRRFNESRHPVGPYISR